MKIVQGDSIEEKAASFHRGGSAKYVHLLEGDPASPVDNYSFIITRTPGRYSPRHRHNFEQYRFQLEGVADYGRTGKLKPGMLGYFPEGVHYGPQTQDEGESLMMLVLQCGGASGSGYAGRAAVIRGQAELREVGTFKDGIFHRNEGVPGKRNVEGFQAIWEHLHGRPLVFPKPRYDVPIFMHPDSYEHVPVEGSPGVSERHLGIFTECRNEAGMVKMDAGATYRPTGKRDIFCVLSGKGKVGREPLRRFTTVFLDFDEEATFKADEPVEMLHLRLPDLRQKMQAGTQEGQVAAE
jgi:hypothetical protein